MLSLSTKYTDSSIGIPLKKPVISLTGLSVCFLAHFQFADTDVGTWNSSVSDNPSLWIREDRQLLNK